jgi:organic hydroperoxide reductase OsmC/OhrA
MQPFPHRYEVEAGAMVTGDVTLESDRLPDLTSAAPVQFGGPGDRWSPETLLVAAVADCFVLTFRTIASMSQLSWMSLRCEAVGTVERIDRITRFTDVTVRAWLKVPDSTDEAKARRLLEKTGQSC